jgi:hypothetical protein
MNIGATAAFCGFAVARGADVWAATHTVHFADSVLFE